MTPEQDPADLSREAQRSGIIPALVPVATKRERAAATHWACNVSGMPSPDDVAHRDATLRAQTARDVIEWAMNQCEPCCDCEGNMAEALRQHDKALAAQGEKEEE